jgi:regulatory protein
MRDQVRITEIRQAVKRSWRRHIYLDGEYWASCDEQTIERLELAVGQTHERQALMRRVAESEGLQYAVNYVLNYGTPSTRRMREKLLKRELSEEMAEAVIAKCIELHYLDDNELARSIIRSHQERGRSKRQIQNKFYSKGLRQDELDEDIFEQAEWDEARALAAAMKRVENRPRDKQIAALRRWGFSWDMIQNVIGELEDDSSGNAGESYKRAELDAQTEARLAVKMRRKYPKPDDERRAIAWGVRNGMSFTRARELWKEKDETT